jgi:hypothetical protein
MTIYVQRTKPKTAALYTVKKDNDFPDPSRDVTNQTLPGHE